MKKTIALFLALFVLITVCNFQFAVESAYAEEEVTEEEEKPEVFTFLFGQQQKPLLYGV